MARNSMVAAIRSVGHLRNILHTATPLPLLNHHHHLIHPNIEVSPSKTLTTTTSSSLISFHQQSLVHHRCFCSSPTGTILLKSEHHFTKSLTNAQDDRHPAVFYFTAAWCGPCKLISPIIEDLSKKYPQVNIYKVDVDEKELQSTLSNLKIYSVPTLHFFHDGKKAGEVVGADVALLKKTMEDLYK